MDIKGATLKAIEKATAKDNEGLDKIARVWYANGALLASNRYIMVKVSAEDWDKSLEPFQIDEITVKGIKSSGYLDLAAYAESNPPSTPFDPINLEPLFKTHGVDADTVPTHEVTLNPAYVQIAIGIFKAEKINATFDFLTKKDGTYPHLHARGEANGLKIDVILLGIK